MPQNAAIVRNASGNLQPPLFRQVSINRHRKDVGERKKARAHNVFAAASTARFVKEWKQYPKQSRRTENENANHLTVNEPYLGGNLLQCLEHEHEVPLGTDSSRGGGKRIGLRSQLPRPNCRQGSKDAES